MISKIEIYKKKKKMASLIIFSVIIYIHTDQRMYQTPFQICTRLLLTKLII